MNLVSQVLFYSMHSKSFFFPFLSLPTGSESNTDPENQVEVNEKRYSYRFSFFFCFQKYKTCFVAKGLMYWCEIWSRLGANTLISIAHQEKAETLRKSYLAPEGLWTLSYYCGLRESLCIEVSERLKSYNQQKVNLSSYLVFLYFSQYPSISFVEMVRCRALIRAGEKEDLVLDYSSFKSYLEVLLCN